MQPGTSNVSALNGTEGERHGKPFPEQSFGMLRTCRHVVLLLLSIYKAFQATPKLKLLYPTQAEMTQQVQRRRVLLGHIGTAKNPWHGKTLRNEGWRILVWLCFANNRAGGSGLKSNS